LRHIGYPHQATVLWRWVDAPQDAEIAAFLAAPAPGLTEDDFYTLMTYARRCVLRAIRTRDPAAALAAFDALSLIEMARVDWRDVVVAASLASHGARRTGLDPELVRTGPVRRAEPAVADLLTNAATSEAGTGGYHELKTATGPVLIDANGPVRGAVALLRTALAVAEVVEDDGRYEVGGIAVERELPAVWLDGGAETERRRLKRCAAVRADPPGSRSHFLLVYVAEAASDEDAAAIAASARRRVFAGAVELGIAVGSRCAVVIARTVVLGEPDIEDDQSLARLADPVTAALRR
jgi:hypothetical protein